MSDGPSPDLAFGSAALSPEGERGERRTLVIDTATAACSVALFERGVQVAAGHEEVGRGHAERLLPMIAALPEGGRAGHILVDVGPGSFTGIRVGIAAARGLALGWGADVSGYGSLAVVAAGHGRVHPAQARPLAVLLEGGHGELFMQLFALNPLRELGPVRSLPPADARQAIGEALTIGDGTRWLGTEDPRIARRGALPRAADALLLPEALRRLPPKPLYGRAPDAKLPTGAPKR